MQVLLVEDDDFFAKAVARTLEKAGAGEFDVARVSRLRDALSHLESHEVDAVILDLGLPDSEGADGLHRLLEANPSLPIIVLTGHEDDALGETLVASGAKAYLCKGVAYGDALLRTIRGALDTSISN